MSTTEAASKESPTTSTPPQTGNDVTTKEEEVVERDENGFPKAILNGGLILYGSRFPKGPGPSGNNQNLEEKCENIRNMEIRPDDVIVCAYMKCGTHWLWEVTRMLLSREATISSKVKEFTMLEGPADLQDLATWPSPRVLNSHLWTCHLPQQIFEKKAKIVHVVRNPKDVVTSYYYHMRRRHSFEWDVLVKYYMENKLSSPHLLAYLKQMQEFQKRNPDQPIITICYEDMIKNPVHNIARLAEFLCVPNDVTFYEQVAKACQFDAMKTADKDREKPHRNHNKGGNSQAGGKFPPGSLYRKGQIWDWKNHFTVAQNEAFDDFLSKEAADLPYTFVYDN